MLDFRMHIGLKIIIFNFIITFSMQYSFIMFTKWQATTCEMKTRTIKQNIL